uniref:RecF/RecN/SMC N-terminal domain-containing protein n=1 Tax=Chloropicon primus TaxID=1764295 RepID=A0A7S2WWX0_9CHLO
MGRGSSFKSFIRRGCNSALVVVTLSNEGEGKEAYKPEVYGSSIIIERRIDVKGASSFAIRDENGRKVAATAWDLRRVLDHMNLLVNNPSVVTTQDTARTFLSNETNDSSRYKLFMDATLLSQVKSNLTGTSLTVDKMKDLLLAKESEVNKKMAELKVAKKRFDHARQIAQHVELESYCENVLVWREVTALSDNLEAITKKLDVSAPRVMEQLKSRLETAMADLGDLESNRKRRILEVQNFTAQGEELQNSVKQSKLALKKLTKQEAAQEKSLEKLKGDLANMQQEKEEMEQVVKENETVDVSGTQSIKDGHKRQIDDAKMREKEVHDELERLQLSMREEKDARGDLNRRLRDKQQAESVLRGKIEDCDRDLQALSSPSRNRGANAAATADMFGQGYSNLLKQIRSSASKFRHPPIGPLGMYLELRDKSWNVAMECAIGGMLGMFILHDEHDFQEFKNCAKRAKMRPPSTVISSFDRGLINVPRNRRPPQGYETVGSALNCTHPSYSHVIWNTLIDNSRIESTILVKNDEEGKRAIFNKEAMPSTRAYTKEGYLCELKGQTQIMRNAVQKRMRPRLSVAGLDRSEQKNEIQAAKGIAEVELESVVSEIRQLKAKLSDRSARCANLEQQIEDRHEKKIQLEEEIRQRYDRLKDELDEAGDGAEDMEAQITAAEVEIANIEQKISKVADMIQQIRTEVETCKAQMEAKQNEMDKIAKQNDAIVSNAQLLDNDVKKAAEQVEKIKDKQNHVRQQISKLKSDLAEPQPIYDSKKEAAEQVCPMGDLEEALKAVEGVLDCALDLRKQEDMAQVEKLLRKLRLNIKEMEKECGNLEELELKFYQCEKEFDQHQKVYVRIREPYELIKESLEDRWGTFESMRRHLQKITSNHFNSNMGKRGHSGQMKFNHKDEKLSISVRMNQGTGKAGSKVKDMKSLSGGERSLSTLNFILALGTECESPFRAADEFDVFMDAVNRKVSLRTLLTFAVDNPHQQMILLTPQDLSQVEEIREEIKGHQDYHQKFIKLIRMPK